MSISLRRRFCLCGVCACTLKNRIFIIAITLLASSSSLIYFAPAQAELRQLRVGVFDNPPIVYRNEHSAITGLSIDVLEHVAAKEDWQIEYRYGAWSEVYDALQRREIDLLVSIAYSPQRAEHFDFTEQTLVNNWGVVYQSGTSDFTSIEDLSGHSVALMTKSIHSRVFTATMQRFGFNFETVPAESYGQVLALVEEGAADAGVINRVFSLTRVNDYNVKPTSIIFNPVQVRYAAPSGHIPALLATLDTHLKQAKQAKNSFYYAAMERWLSRPAEQKDFQWLVYLLLSIVGLLFLVALYSYSVRRQVKQRTAQLADSEERFRQIAEYVNEVFWIGSPDWQKVLYINPAYERIWGRSCASLYRDPLSWLEAVHADDRAAVEQAIDEKSKGNIEDPRFPPYRIVREDGSVRWILARAYPVTTKAGSMLRIVGYAQDITDFKTTEQALRDSERRYRNLLDIAQEGIWVIDANGITTYVNPAMAQMLHYEVHEMYGLPLEKFMRPDEFALAGEMISRRRQGIREQHDFELLTKDGDSIYVAMETAPIFDDAGNYSGAIAGVIDLTRRREAEEELKRSEERYRTISEHAPEAIVVLDAERGRFVDANKNAERLFRISREQLLNTNPFELSPERQPGGGDMATLAQRYIERAMNGEVPTFEWWHKDAEGREFPCEIRLVKLPGPKPLIRGSVNDITERKAIERALEESEERFELAVAGSQDGLWDWRIGERLWWSPRLFEFLGFEDGAFEPVFEEFMQRIHPDDRPLVYDAIEAHFTQNDPLDIEFRVKRADGEYIWFRSRGQAVRNEAGEVVRMAGSVQDITDRRKVTESMRMYEHIVSASRDFMAFVDRDYCYRAVNDTYRKAFGKDVEAIVGTRVEDLFGQQQFRKNVKPLIDRAFAGETVKKQQWYTLPEMGQRYLDVSMHPHRDAKHEITGVVIDAHDLTDMKHTEDALLRSETRYAQSQRAANVGSWEWNIKTNEVFWSDMVEPIFGLAKGQFEGTLESFIERIHPDDKQAVLDAVEDAISTKHAYSVEHRVIRPDAEVRWVHEYGDLIYDDAGEVQGITGIVQDITERKLAEQSQQRLMQILDKTPDFIGMAEPDGRVFYINPAGQSMMEWSSGRDYSNTHIKDYVTGDVLRRINEDFVPYAIKYGVWRGESELLTEGGKHIPILQTIIAHKSPIGKLEYLSTVARDISERKKVEETLRALAEEGVGTNFNEFIGRIVQYLARVYDARYAFMGMLVEPDNTSIATEAVWVDGSSPSLQENFTYELKGTPCQDILNRDTEIIPRDAARLYPEDELLRTMEVESYFGAPLIVSGGKTVGLIAVMDTKPMLLEPWLASLLGVFASRVAIEWERKQVLDELNRHRENLEELVSERTADLESVNKELEAFSYSVSHDLRAPLRAVDGFSQALYEDYYHQFDDQARDYLERVRRGAQRMGQLIEDLLQLSRITRAQLLREDVDLGETVRQCFEKLQQEEPARKARIRVDVKHALIVEGDPRLLEIALNNLVTNAWKYTRNLDESHFEFGAQQEEGQRVFYLSDNGAGFDMRYANKLFAPFQRLHAPEEFEGIGVGLATVQRILHRHGGKIWAKGEPGKGATFYFTLD